ncbi:hypothetical protein [Streptomyces sp. TR02-1]|uniref:hypothetical protein n=1 Tax=Streptomyces sp. TR02-1 TaxID=3385977 RepID=UPI00399EF5F2
MAGDGLDALNAKRAKNARKKPSTSSSQNASGDGGQDSGSSGTQQDRVRRQPPRPLHRKAEPAPAAAEPQQAPVAEEKPPPAPEPARPAAPPAPGPAPVTEPPPSAPSGRTAEAPPAPPRPEPEPAPAAAEPQQAPVAEEKPPPAPEPARPASEPSVTGAELARHMASAAPAPAAEGAPQWDQYTPPPVPEGFPRAENVLLQRFIDREPLNASVPEPLQIAHRLQLLKVVSRINHIPQGDLVTVALDWWLRGGKPTTSDIDPPWNSYTGPGTPGDVPHAEDVLQQRFINRETLKASVPKPLELNHRLTTYKVLNRLHKVPVGDVVAVAMDRWLRIMGF